MSAREGRMRPPGREARCARAAIAPLAAALALLAAGLVHAPPAAIAAPIPAEARIERSTIDLGENLTLEITVRGPVSEEPSFDVPGGLEMLGQSSSRSYEWIDGHSRAETIFHYELAGSEAGRYTLGPFRVGVGGEIVSVPAIAVTVLAAATSIGSGSGQGPASLLADVEPRDPYVGQPVVLRVRLVQRAALAEDPQYAPPSTPGFWSEPASQPESYYAAEGNARVLVTETRTRLYPLASGNQTVGEAVARLALLEGGTSDPARWSGGRVPRREMMVRSPVVAVHVRALPGGAPAGFGGAVGVLSTRWDCDRGHTERDVPASVELDVRGIGNLSLIHAPTLESDDFEVFAGDTEDSLGAPGQPSAGRRTFRWTLLPRREGTLTIPPPAFAWFDPAAQAYRSASLAALSLEVGPALNAAGGSEQTFPPQLFDRPVRPFGVPLRPWAFLLAGLLAGIAVSLARARAPGAAPGRRAEIEALRATLAASGGVAFWKRAEETLVWLETEGALPPALRERIGSARYSSAMTNPVPVRRELDQILAARLPRERTLPRRALAMLLGVAAIAVACLGMPRPGPESAAAALRAADDAARAGVLDQAHSGWLSSWKSGVREAPLAARLAWYEIRSGAVGPAAAWVLAGEAGEARDPALAWVRDRVREAGGLSGEGAGRLPIRRAEWAGAAAAFAFAAALLRRRRRIAVVAGLIALVSAVAFPLEDAWLRGLGRAVVRAPSTIEGTEIELEPGQVVRITGRDGARVMVSAGRGASGWIPAPAVFGVEELQ